MVEINFYDCEYDGDSTPTYVIIGARFRGEWLFVKNRKRGSYELPAGHIDKDESAYAAAGRELMEETGAKKFILECLNTYTVKQSGNKLRGMLFFAAILEKGDIEDTVEIEDCVSRSSLPENLTFPEVQLSLFSRLEEFVNTRIRVN